jgi:gluconate 2-dehydrogenase gamma chain
MNRREAIRLLAAGAAAPLAPGKLMFALRRARALVGAQTSFRALNPHQAAALTAMAEMIIPKTDTPGATDVGAVEFIDLLLTEWYDAADKDRFLKGLAGVDARSQTLFNKDFVDCTPTQQAEILSWLGEKMAEQADHERDNPWVTSSEGESFYPMLRHMILTAYYTSEAGATDELHFEIIPGRYDGCTGMDAGKEGEK